MQANEREHLAGSSNLKSRTLRMTRRELIAAGLAISGHSLVPIPDAWRTNDALARNTDAPYYDISELDASQRAAEYIAFAAFDLHGSDRSSLQATLRAWAEAVAAMRSGELM